MPNRPLRRGGQGGFEGGVRGACASATPHKFNNFNERPGVQAEEIKNPRKVPAGETPKKQKHQGPEGQCRVEMSIRGAPSTPPPPPKILPAAFLFVELISSGLPEKSVTWLPEIISGELIPWGYRKVWPGLSAV